MFEEIILHLTAPLICLPLSFTRMDRPIQHFSEKAVVFFLILFGALLPYDMLYATLALYPLVLFTLLGADKSKIRRIPKEWWIFTVYFVLSVIGYTYTRNTEKSAYLIERQLLFCLFPILLPVGVLINRQLIDKVLTFMSWSCVAAILYLFYHCVATISGEHLALSELLKPRFYNHNFTAPIGIHATYLSLYVALSILFLTEQFSAASRIKKALNISAMAVLIVGLYFLAARNTSFAVLLSVAFIYPLFRVRNKKTYVVGVLSVLVLVAFAASKSSYIRNRFSKDMMQDLGPKSVTTFENPEPRITRWQCAADIIKQQPVFGYGSGEEIPLLKQCYEERNLKLSYLLEFNTHNQYLAVLIRNGLMGLLVLAIQFFYFFRLAIRQKDFLYCSFLLLICLGCITENLLDANKGIFFFALFNTLFGYNLLRERKDLRAEKKTRTTL
jgi:O-antigen ligase